MELPRGISIVSEQKPAKKIVCPVVQQYRLRDLEKTLPYDSTLPFDQIRDHWFCGAMKHAKGNMSEAARLLGVARETVRRWGMSEKK